MAKKLRNKIFMTKVQFKEKIVKLGEDEVLLKQPSLAMRNELYKLAGKMDMKKGDMEIDLTKLQIYAVIMCAYDPETREPIFEKGDYKELSTSALGTYIINEIGTEAMNLLEVKLEPKKQDKK